MKIVELGGQVQCRLEDGSVCVVSTPSLSPTKLLTVDDVREALMSLGEDTQSKMRRDGGIIQAAGIPGNLRLRRDE